MGTIKILKPGSLTTIQDRGRYGYQQFGIPVAGAMDEYALRIANYLVDNDENEGCLEITLLGPTIEFTEETLIAITGADLGAKINDKPCPLWQAILVKKGDLLKFTGVRGGCRAYLAIAGGFDVPIFMESKSTYVRGQLGGFQGRPLKAGDEVSIFKIPANKKAISGRTVPGEYKYKFANSITLRVVLGPQKEAFSEKGLNTFLTSTYQISNEADRMGYRLTGEIIEHKKGADIISDGIAIGSVQVPGHGSPIIMMADRQTTGGYTKIATVITPDLRKLAQAKPGDSIKFQAISIEEAQQIYLDYENKLQELKNNFTKLSNSNIKKRKLRLKVNGIEYLVEVEEI